MKERFHNSAFPNLPTFISGTGFLFKLKTAGQIQVRVQVMSAVSSIKYHVLRFAPIAENVVDEIPDVVAGKLHGECLPIETDR
jgi:hypothetical protein